MIEHVRRLLRREIQYELEIILSKTAAQKTAMKVSDNLSAKVVELINKRLRGALGDEPVDEPAGDSMTVKVPPESLL